MSEGRLKRLVTNPTVKVETDGRGRVDLEDIESDVGTVLTESLELPERDGEGVAFQPGDVLFGKLRPYLRKAALAKCSGACSPELVVLRPQADLIDSRFLYHLVQSRPFVAWAVASSKGVRMPRTDFHALSQFRLRLPALDEQRSIADSLDAELGILAASEANLSRLRGLIGERAAASVSVLLHCTRLLAVGSDLHADWSLIRLKFLARLQAGVTLGKKYRDPDLVERPYLRVANVQDGRLDLADVSSIVVPERDVSRHELQPGDVLMTEGGDSDKLGRGAVWDGEISGCLHQNHVFAVRPDRRRLRPEYLAAVMGSTHGKAYFQSTAHQTTNLASTNSAKLMSFQIPLPPVEEQDQLLQELHIERDRAIRLDALLRAQRRLVTERRQALITAAVTGQLDPSSYRQSPVAR